MQDKVTKTSETDLPLVPLNGINFDPFDGGGGDKDPTSSQPVDGDSIEYKGLPLEQLERKLETVWQRIHKKGYQKDILVEKSWKDKDDMFAEFLPRYAWASHLSSAKYSTAPMVYTFMKRINSPDGFVRGNFGPTLPDAESFGSRIFHDSPYVTGSREGYLLGINASGNSLPLPLKGMITPGEWKTAWELARRPSDARIPTMEDVHDVDPHYSTTYNEVILETKIAAKDGIFSQTLAKNYLDKDPNLTPEDLLDKIYEKVTNTLTQNQLIGGKVKKESWEKIITQLAKQYDKPRSLVTEIMVKNEGVIWKVVKHLSLFETRAKPVWLWDDGVLVVSFCSIKEASEVTDIPIYKITSMCDKGDYFKNSKLQFTRTADRPLPPEANENQAQWALKLWKALEGWLRDNTLPPNVDKALENLIKGYSIQSTSKLTGVDEKLLKNLLDRGFSSISEFGKEVA